MWAPEKTMCRPYQHISNGIDRKKEEPEVRSRVIQLRHVLEQAIGNSPGVHRELAKGIGSLLGWCKGVRQKKTKTRRKIVGGSRKACREDREARYEHIGRLLEEDHRTRRKNAEGYRIGGRSGLHPKKIDSGRRCASRRRTREWT
ncbi:hypothetical protein GW17_00052130 [Ensete ventricosum]|nr:hypothetical protein GW17_00052130 [Ensete ventricosum]